MSIYFYNVKKENRKLFIVVFNVFSILIKIIEITFDLINEMVFKKVHKNKKFIDLTNKFPPVYDQGNLDSSIGFAAVKGLVEFYLRNTYNIKMPMSALSAFYRSRISGNYSDYSYILSTFLSLFIYGCSSEFFDEYTSDNFKSFPSSLAIKEAEVFRLKNFRKLFTLNDIKRSLIKESPVVCGISVFSSFENGNTWRSGLITTPDLKEKRLGSHAVCIVGFDDSKKHFIIRNSFSKSWGNNGYGFLPYEYLKKYGFDFYTAKI